MKGSGFSWPNPVLAKSRVCADVKLSLRQVRACVHLSTFFDIICLALLNKSKETNMPNSTQSMIPRWLVWGLGLVLFIVLALVALDKSYSLKQSMQSPVPNNTISVAAEGKVKAVPDLATVDLGVITNASTAAEAQEQSTRKLNAIIEFVKKQGVPGEDITTSQFNIYPQQDFQGGRTVITAYSANQNIIIKVRGVDESTDKLSKVLGGVTAAGANQINGVSLSFDNPDDLRGQAREQAIATAKQKAKELANAAGLRLGRVVNVIEDSGYGIPPMPYAGGFGGRAMDAAAEAMPDFQAGNQDVVVNMTVVFEVR